MSFVLICLTIAIDLSFMVIANLIGHYANN
jgi:hypothetical protein